MLSKIKSLAILIAIAMSAFCMPVMSAFADDFGSENADGIVGVSASGTVSPEYDALTDSYANSWRYIDGIPGDDGLPCFLVAKTLGASKEDLGYAPTV